MGYVTRELYTLLAIRELVREDLTNVRVAFAKKDGASAGDGKK